MKTTEKIARSATKKIKFRLPTGSILGTFSKGTWGSVSISFGVSGGVNCDTGCQFHPRSEAREPNKHTCYAVRLEIRPDRSQVLEKLKRHERMPAALVCGKALLELQELVRKGRKPPWVRFSTNGSLPQPDDVRGDKLFRRQLRALVRYCVSQGIPVHFPVETYGKARFYRSLVGDLVTVRESAVSTERFLLAKGSVSCGIAGKNRIETVEKSREVAKRRRERTGRKTVVCPAVLNSWAAMRNKSALNNRAKCGVCVACSSPTTDIVYPGH